MWPGNVVTNHLKYYFIVENYTWNAGMRNLKIIDIIDVVVGAIQGADHLGCDYKDDCKAFIQVLL